MKFSVAFATMVATTMSCTNGFVIPPLTSSSSSSTTTFIPSRTYNKIITVSALSSSKNDNNNNDWDANVDYSKEWPKESKNLSPDPTSDWNIELPDTFDTDSDGTPKLGISIELDDLTPEQAAELKAEATDIIEKGVASGIKDVETLRDKLKSDLEKSRTLQNLASQVNAQETSRQLASKIASKTTQFLKDSAPMRESTKLASAADQASVGKGIDMGTWGVVDGATVVAGISAADGSSASLLGSVNNAIEKRKQSKPQGENGSGPQSRILIVADQKGDPLAKQLVPTLMEQMEKNYATTLPNVAFDVFTPTSTIPLGGNNADCVVLFLSSFSDPSSIKSVMERMLRKTVTAEAIGQPPTQFIGVSTVGTERVEKMPYSMQNLMGGGKLNQRRQMEEAIINVVKNRVTEPSLDYTIVKFGEMKSNKKSTSISLSPGDVLDGTTSPVLASNVLIQAMAFQPFARNSTFCAIGDCDNNYDITSSSSIDWDANFLCLQGPEIWRMDNVGSKDFYLTLIEYLSEWGTMLAESGKGLTTPIMCLEGLQPSPFVGYTMSTAVDQQSGIQLLFLPTATGKNYMSRKEEMQRESETGRTTTASTKKPVKARKMSKDGGIEIVVEIPKGTESLRVRARRCNYGPDVAIKELSEETILARLQDAINAWKKKHM